MTVKIIIAADRANAIGWEDGRLPWKLSGDMKRFKELTSGHTIVMGRKTFESFNRPAGLPNRRNVVLTNDSAKRTPHDSNPWFFKDGHDSLSTFVQVHQACLGCTPPDLWIIGGGSIYTQAILHELVDEIYLTCIDTNSKADVSLPFDLFNWKHFILHQRKIGVQWILQEITDPQSENGLNFVYVTLKKQA